MARDSERPVCPRRQCPLHPDGRASAPGQVDWAGLPINLDMAFSRVQRDKVYVQHVMRKQGSRLSRWVHHGAQPCACEVAEDATLEPDAAEAIQIASGKR